MNLAWTSIALLACVLSVSSANAQSSTTADRIAISADGTALTGTNGGGGASLGWLHNFDESTIAGIAIEHQVLANAQWTFGSLNASSTIGPENQRYSFYGEAHEGSGHDGFRAFDYKIEAAGVIGTFDHKLSAQIEDKRIDVESTHGNLPKVGLSYLWSPHLMTSVAYQYSVNGNLGTRLPSVRIDGYSAAVNLFGGVTWGPSSLVVLNLPSGVFPEVRRLKEGYVGASKPFPKLRSEMTLVADYIDLSGIKKSTVTLNYIFHVGR